MASIPFLVIYQEIYRQAFNHIAMDFVHTFTLMKSGFKIFSLAVFVSGNLISGLRAQDDFYDVNKVQEIRINFSFSNWDYRMDTAIAGSEGYIMAQSCIINGVQFDSVGVKYKGNSSYRATNSKNPLHIELDWIRGNQDYQGYSDIKLSNGFSDPSCIREVLGYRILRHYMHCPQSNFAKVFINGNYYGLMANTENIGRSFVKKHFDSNDNTFIKCNPAVAGPGGSTSSLEYLGTDSSLYYSRYEMRSAGGWKDLVDLCNTLKNNASQIHTRIDIDRALWMLAFNVALVNLDSYHGAFSQNYYLYKDNEGLLNSIVWDLNMCFGGFSMLSAGGGPGGGGNLSITQMQNMSPTIQSTNTTRPLINKLLANARYRKIYLAHMKTIVQEMLSSNQYLAMADTLRAVADSAIQADQNALFTYAQFQSAMTSNLGSGPQQIPGIQTLLAARKTYLSSTAEFTDAAPLITSPQLWPEQPLYNQNLSIRVQASNATGVFIGYRHRTDAHFTQQPMFDDGLHNDGAAGDGMYAIDLLPEQGLFQYYFLAENASAASLLPARAEHEFFTTPVWVSGVLPGQIRINEILAQNQIGEQDETGSYEDWLELMNIGDTSLNLFGLYLSDDRTLLHKWPFPQGINLAPGGFLSVWADNDTSSQSLHAGFKLSASGEALFLSNSLGEIIDSLVFGSQVSDVSLGRCPDGSGDFIPNAVPTKGAPNNCSTQISLRLSGEKTRAWFTSAEKIEIRSLAAFSQVRLLDVTGREIHQWAGSAVSSLSLAVKDAASAVFILQIPGQKAIRLIR